MTKVAVARRRRRSDPEPRPRPLADEVLRMIWREQRISRAEIARRADLSRSTVSEIVGGLLATELVDEVGTGPSIGGRRPIVLEFQDSAAVILGVELGATHVGVALTDLRGRVIAWEYADHPVRTDPEGTRALAIRLCEACLAQARVGRRRLVGVGIAVPSPVDQRHPDHLSEIVLPDWGGRGGLDLLRTRLGVPIFVDNDANMGAATGVGSGHVIHGDIYRGATGVAGEIGHMAIDPHGEPCVCGLRGCLATLVGAPALVARARALLGEYAGSSLASAPITIAAIEDAALAGDALALRLAHETAGHLGIAIAGLLNLMNPALVILGGGLSRLGRLLLDPLQETVHRRTLVSSVAASEIRMSALGPRSVAIGAATMVLKEALADSRRFPAAIRRRRS